MKNIKSKPAFMSPDENPNPGQQPACYLTLNVVGSTDIFVRPVFRQIIAESLNYFIAKKGLIVHGWCLMTNHLHLIARAHGSLPLAALANEFKEFTSKIILEDIDAESEDRKAWILKNLRVSGHPLRFMDKYQVWQKGLTPIYIDPDNPEVLGEHLEYIHTAPVRERIVARPEDYLYSSARDYAGLSGLVTISMLAEQKDTDFILRHISAL